MKTKVYILFALIFVGISSVLADLANYTPFYVVQPNGDYKFCNDEVFSIDHVPANATTDWGIKKANDQFGYWPI